MEIQNRLKYFRLVRFGHNGAGDPVVVRKDSLEVEFPNGANGDDAEIKKVVDVVKLAKHSYQASVPFRLGEVLAECTEYYAVCQNDDTRKFMHDLILDAYKNIRKLESRFVKDTPAT